MTAVIRMIGDSLRALFGGGGQQPGVDRDGRALWLYVRPHRCDDVLRVRIDMMNDLSQRDDGDGYHVRKLASSANYRCSQVELEVDFDRRRRIERREVSGGAFVEREDWEAWQAAQSPS